MSMQASSVFDATPNEFFAKKLIDFEPLLRYAAKRFEIQGVLSREDLYQEGLVALITTFEEHWEVHPDSDSFERSFKSRLFNSMSNCLRKHKTQSRDWKKELRDVISEKSGSDKDFSPLNSIPQTTFPSPDYALEIEDIDRYLDALENDLSVASIRGQMWGNTAEDALEIFKLVTDPNLDVPDEVKECYERLPRGLSNAIIAELTGWDLMKVRRAISRMRKHARRLAPDYGIHPPKEF